MIYLYAHCHQCTAVYLRGFVYARFESGACNAFPRSPDAIHLAVQLSPICFARNGAKWEGPFSLRINNLSGAGRFQPHLSIRRPQRVDNISVWGERSLVWCGKGWQRVLPYYWPANFFLRAYRKKHVSDKTQPFLPQTGLSEVSRPLQPSLSLPVVLGKRYMV